MMAVAFIPYLHGGRAGVGTSIEGADEVPQTQPLPSTASVVHSPSSSLLQVSAADDITGLNIDAIYRAHAANCPKTRISIHYHSRRYVLVGTPTNHPCVLGVETVVLLTKASTANAPSLCPQAEELFKQAVRRLIELQQTGPHDGPKSVRTLIHEGWNLYDPIEWTIVQQQ